MSTMRDLVQRAHERLGEVGFGQTMSPDQLLLGMNAANEMMFAWANSGVDISHVRIVSTDTFPLADRFFAGVAAMLALRLAEDYGQQVGSMPRLLQDAKNGWHALEATYIMAPQADTDTALKRLPSQRRFIGAQT